MKTVADDTEGELDDEIQALVTSDFEIGHYIRERIVPRAVLFYTGILMNYSKTIKEEINFIHFFSIGEGLEDEEDDYDDEEGEDGDEEEEDEEDCLTIEQANDKPAECKSQ